MSGARNLRSVPRLENALRKPRAEKERAGIVDIHDNDNYDDNTNNKHNHTTTTTNNNNVIVVIIMIIKRVREEGPRPEDGS